MKKSETSNILPYTLAVFFMVGLPVGLAAEIGIFPAIAVFIGAFLVIKGLASTSTGKGEYNE